MLGIQSEKGGAGGGRGGEGWWGRSILSGVLLPGASSVVADAEVGIGNGAHDALVTLTGQAPLTGTLVVNPIERLGRALAVLSGLGRAAGQAQPGVPVAAAALALGAVQAELAVFQVDNYPPWVRNRIDHCEGHEQKDKDLLHDERGQLGKVAAGRSGGRRQPARAVEL